ncbi:hypothetical protein HanPI659440_Chr04g0157801 [Helianthus annuus]|nr:hypothetical protein HanPI659440_Chr04g0157801 [Helianthus annuus]
MILGTSVDFFTPTDGRIGFHGGSVSDTLAIEPDVTAMVKNDLDMFPESRDFYRKIGKAWKRGYLLYGPPTTPYWWLKTSIVQSSCTIEPRGAV